MILSYAYCTPLLVRKTVLHIHFYKNLLMKLYLNTSLQLWIVACGDQSKLCCLLVKTYFQTNKSCPCVFSGDLLLPMNKQVAFNQIERGTQCFVVLILTEWFISLSFRKMVFSVQGVKKILWIFKFCLHLCKYLWYFQCPSGLSWHFPWVHLHYTCPGAVCSCDFHQRIRSC